MWEEETTFAVAISFKTKVYTDQDVVCASMAAGISKSEKKQEQDPSCKSLEHMPLHGPT